MRSIWDVSFVSALLLIAILIGIMVGAANMDLARKSVLDLGIAGLKVSSRLLAN